MTMFCDVKTLCFVHCISKRGEGISDPMCCDFKTRCFVPNISNMVNARVTLYTMFRTKHTSISKRGERIGDSMFCDVKTLCFIKKFEA